jgi:hypothetical protein
MLAICVLYCCNIDKRLIGKRWRKKRKWNIKKEEVQNKRCRWTMAHILSSNRTNKKLLPIPWKIGFPGVSEYLSRFHRPSEGEEDKTVHEGPTLDAWVDMNKKHGACLLGVCSIQLPVASQHRYNRQVSKLTSQGTDPIRYWEYTDLCGWSDPIVKIKLHRCLEPWQSTGSHDIQT